METELKIRLQASSAVDISGTLADIRSPSDGFTRRSWRIGDPLSGNARDPRRCDDYGWLVRTQPLETWDFAPAVDELTALLDGNRPVLLALQARAPVAYRIVFEALVLGTSPSLMLDPSVVAACAGIGATIEADFIVPERTA